MQYKHTHIIYMHIYIYVYIHMMHIYMHMHIYIYAYTYIYIYAYDNYNTHMADTQPYPWVDTRPHIPFSFGLIYIHTTGAYTRPLPMHYLV